MSTHLTRPIEMPLLLSKQMESVRKLQQQTLKFIHEFQMGFFFFVLPLNILKLFQTHIFIFLCFVGRGRAGKREARYIKLHLECALCAIQNAI